MTWHLSWVFTYSSMQASVVDLPLPVAPDTKMMPRSLIAIFLSVSGEVQGVEIGDLAFYVAHRQLIWPRCV